jgi:tRNA dimethylallyltransferase
LEVCISTGKPFSSFRKNQKVERPFNIIKIALERPREELYARIDKRMDIMLANGLEAEAKSVIEFREHYALKTVGYREIYEHLDGEYDREEMVRLLKRNSRRYAKRQMTWFKNQDEFHWFDAKNEEEIISFVREQINRR